MSDERLIISRQYCDGVGDGLRYAYGGEDEYYPSQWENAIKGLKKTLGTKNISANGDYSASSDNMDGFSDVHVEVANTYTQADEGKVVDSGALVAQTSKTITTNGTHVTTTNNEVIVNVSAGGGGGVLAKLGSSSEIVTLSGQYGPMGDASNDYVTPVSSDTRQNVTINTAQPFEIKCTFKLTQAFTDPTYILGDLTNNTGTPQIVLRSFNGDYFQLVSYYNNGGTAAQRAESFYPSENYSLPLNTDIEIIVTYDGTDLTASMDDGTDQASVTFSNYTPYTTNDAVCEFGGSQGGLYGLAGNSGAYLNIDKCYIKQGSTYLWKAESGVTVEPITINQDGVYAAPSGKAYNPVTVAVSQEPAEPDLPNTYQEVEYIAFDGDCYFTCDFPNIGLVIIDYEQTALDSGSLVIGYRGSSTDNKDYNLGSTGGIQRWYVRNSIYMKDFVLEEKGNNRFKGKAINGTGHTSVYVGRYWGGSGGYPFVGKLYRFSMLRPNTGVYVFCLVPCYRLSDNVIGFYDVVNSVFYTNEGNGSFAKGPDVT